jgi:hypothetical protein
MEIDGEMLAQDTASLATLRNELSSIFNPQLAGTLIYQSDNGKNYEIDVLVEQAPILDDVQGSITQTFQLKFQAINPCWIDKDEADKIIPLSTVANHFKFPVKIVSGFTFAGIQSGTIQTINNKGDISVGMTIQLKFNADTVNPKILNVSTQEFFGFTGTYAAGTVLTVVTTRGSKSVTKVLEDGTSSNAMSERMTGSTFLQLAKGNNFLSLSADSGETNVIGNVTYSPMVMGV